MELIYLWVEDYKNIHKQGFNFSPRFTCDYNYEKNELTIKENDDYIENFFGENITRVYSLITFVILIYTPTQERWE